MRPDVLAREKLRRAAHAYNIRIISESDLEHREKQKRTTPTIKQKSWKRGTLLTERQAIVMASKKNCIVAYM